jgi:hypothetical protein
VAIALYRSACRRDKETQKCPGSLDWEKPTLMSCQADIPA